MTEIYWLQVIGNLGNLSVVALIFFDLRGYFNKSVGCHTDLCVAMACGMEIWFEDLQAPQNI